MNRRVHPVQTPGRRLSGAGRRPRLAIFLGLFVGVVAGFGQTTLYWDANGSTPGSGNNGGQWSTAGGARNRKWTTNSAGTSGTSSWTSGANAIFSAGTDSTGSFTVTVSGTQNVASITVQEGNPTLSSGTLNFNSTSPFIDVASGSTLDVASKISGSAGLTKSGAGTLLLNSALNNWTGGLAINAGLVELSTSNVITDTNAVSIGSGATLQIDSGISETLSSISGSGTVSKVGAGTLTFASTFDFSGGSLTLSGGTLALASGSSSIGTLHITGDTVIDFGNSAASTLTVTSLLIDAGVNLTIANWVDATDYFFAQGWSGATPDARNIAPMNQVTFTGFSSSTTAWLNFDSQITPVPEPATYGAVFAALMLGWVAWRRRESLG
ncbi:MAG: autotransporter-associated beta strand repeat-containing protein [Verrucomicrobia bacterium]|nr:autotransporter-associated beta strand repeat-containing protein [Verrucomicrobiota bacterium]